MDDTFVIESKFWVTRSYGFRRQFQLRFGERRDGHVYVAQPLVMKEQPIEDIVDPFMSIGTEMAQELMDSLWNCGVRPSEQGADNVGKEKALLNHLEDMRRLVPGLQKYMKIP